jgi:adenylosuccinate lyase
MPAKRNPEKCENICSLARLMRSFVIVALENVPLWHERDITNSGNERFIIPQACIIMDEMLRKMTAVLKGLTVIPENMKRNLEFGEGLIMSESIMLLLAKKGLGRQEAHELVRQCAMESIKTRKPFRELLLQNRTIRSEMTEDEIEDALNPEKYLGKSAEIVDRAIRLTAKEREERGLS